MKSRTLLQKTKLIVHLIVTSLVFIGAASSVSGNPPVDEILHFFECDNVLKNWIENSTKAVFDVENATLIVDLNDLQERLWSDLAHSNSLLNIWLYLTGLG